MKTLTCREHGGTFAVQPSRGRPPTRCGGKWELCTKAHDEPVNISTGKAIKVPKLTDEQAMERRKADSAAIREVPVEQTMPPSIARAMEAKAALEAQGWLCKGRSYTDDDKGHGVELMATRGDELLIMHWLDGQCVNQEYQLWHEKPSANNKPAGSLTFDPDECTDRELIRTLSGCKVTWWNALGQFEMSGIIDPGKIRIEHLYNGHGDETPSDRIIHFIDRAGGGFRAFRLGALLKVG